jgi:hypothetical protein
MAIPISSKEQPDVVLIGAGNTEFEIFGNLKK